MFSGSGIRLLREVKVADGLGNTIGGTELTRTGNHDREPENGKILEEGAKMAQRYSKGLRLPALLAIALLCMCGAWAQTGNQGMLTLTVEDASGGVVPGAALALKDKATNDVRQATTLENGTYSFAALSAGTYTLTVSNTGFKDSVYDTIEIHASRVTDLIVKLTVGSVAEKVVVSADQAPLVETSSNVIGTTIDLKEIEYLPMTDRDPTQFAYFLPGAAGGYWNNQQHQAEVTAVDGTIAMSSRFKAGGGIGAVATPRLQNVEEITIQTSGLNSNQGYGQAAMSAVLATRRGTNEYHGRAFANLQNSSLNANSWYNDYYGAPKPLYHKNDFGGSVGGPILKNKLFFFASYEQDSIPGKGTGTNSFMTQSMQSGNYTYLGTDGNSHTVNLLDLAGAAGLQSTMDTGVAAELTKINASLSGGTIGTVGGADQYESQNVKLLTFNEPNNQYFYYPTFRVDYTAKDNLRVNLALNEEKTSAPTSLFPTFPGSDFKWMQDGTKSTAYTAAIGVDWTIKPTLINQFQGGYLYNYAISAPKSADYNRTHDIVWWVGPWGLNYGTGAASGDFFYSTISNFYPLFSFNDNLVWQKGAHNITFGASFYREQDHYWNPPQGYDNVVMGMGGGDPGLNVFSTSNPALATANGTQLGEMQSYYAILTGDLSIVAGSHPINPKTHQYQQYGALNLDELQTATGLFFQDSWRVKPNLTVNVGLRWDFTGDDHDLNGIYYSPTTAGLWGPSGLNNAFKPGTLSGDADPAFIARGHAYAPWKKSPQPNIGVAWTPQVSEGWLGKLLGGSDTVIRAGYSLRRYTPQFQDFWTYASNYGAFFYQNYQLEAAGTNATGFYQAGTEHYANYLNGTFPTDYLVSPSSYSAQLTEASQAWQSSLMGMDPNIPQPYVQSWNVGLQRKLGESNVVEVRYVGNRSVHQWMPLNLNEVNIFENGFLDEFKTAQTNLAANGGTSFQGGTGSTPIMDTAFQDNMTGGYTYGGFIWNLQHGQVGTMAGDLATPFGATSNYFCNLVSTTFTPCENILGYSGNGGSYPINLFQVNPYAAGTSVSYLAAAGYSNYNALQIELRQENWHGMHFTANYSWSRSLGLSNQYTLRNLRLGYGPTGADIHHVLNILGTYDLPFGKDKTFLNHGVLLDRVVGGWTLGTTNVITSGAPFQMTGGNNTYNNLFDGGINLTGVTNKQLQKAIGYRKTTDTTGYAAYWIDPKYITAGAGSNSTYLSPNSTPGSLGTRYWLWGTRYWKPNLSVSKSVEVKDHMRFNLQGEVLDVFNHPRRSIGDAGLQDSSFGATFGKASSNYTSTGLNFGRVIEIRANFEF